MRAIPLALLCVLLLPGCPSTTGDDDDSATGDDDDSATGDDDDDTSAATRYGPENEWWSANEGDVPAEPPGAAWEVGSTAPNFSMWDQNGDEVELYQFYGQHVVLDILGEWCPPCVDAAPHGQFAWELMGGDDFTYLAVLMSDRDYNTPSQLDPAAGRWAERFGLTHPVVNDYEGLFEYIGILPTYFLLGPDMEIVATHGGSPGLDWFSIQLMLGDHPDAPEVCDDGVDNDRNYRADCLDPSCADTPACADANTYRGEIRPCDAAPAVRGIDSWTITVPPGTSTRVTVDTVSAATTFDPVLFVFTEPGDHDTRAVGWVDDSFECDYPPVEFSCPVGVLGEGTWEVAIEPGGAGDGTCADPAVAGYELRLTGSATAVPALDDESVEDIPALRHLL